MSEEEGRERREKQESTEEIRRIYGNWKRMDACKEEWKRGKE